MSKPEMASAEFRRLQAQIGCTGKWLSGQLGVTPDTISRWRFQEEGITGPVVLAMKALASGWRP